MCRASARQVRGYLRGEPGNAPHPESKPLFAVSTPTSPPQSRGRGEDSAPACAIPICVLVRPRPGDFVYTDTEFDTLVRDAEWFHREGATVVAGVLNPDRTVDRDRCARLPRGSVFHRAFDEIPDRFAAMETLIELGFRRILTSGGAATAPEGAEELAALIRAARGRIEILPGGGITPDNASELVHRTGATWIHGSFRCGGATTDPDAIRRLK
ncbi:MAG: copper homeostasis protein CutC [Gemmataceae bacterium]